MKRKGSLRRVKGISMGAEVIALIAKGIAMIAEGIAMRAKRIALIAEGIVMGTVEVF